jgi:hypothetical protein
MENINSVEICFFLSGNVDVFFTYWWKMQAKLFLLKQLSTLFLGGFLATHAVTFYASMTFDEESLIS